ncbi:MAG TPA: hypothetical protein VIL31_08410 [Cyclobacteriaceae bacterium]|jgi:hypothetical protein
MLREFEALEASEVELMLKAPILVCMLVAGADGKIDSKEVNKAIQVARRKAKSSDILWQYFSVASEDFEDKLRILLRNYPNTAEARNEILVEELAALNAVLPRVESSFRRQFYSLLKELAREVAASSGGLLGYNAIDKEEAKYIGLDMIRPPELI